MRALDRALFRDLGRLRAQVLTLSLVVAAGASVFVAMKLTVDALDGARAEYFRAQRLGDLFGSLKRAPRALLPDLAAISGVAQVDARDRRRRAAVRARSSPAGQRAAGVARSARARRRSTRCASASGRLPDADHDDEVVLNEPFADATHLRPGDAVSAVLNGRLHRLRVVGVGISPEFVFQLPPGVMSPNDERYGVAWMLRAPLEAAFDLRRRVQRHRGAARRPAPCAAR